MDAHARPRELPGGAGRSSWAGVSVEWSLEPGDAETARRIRHLITDCLRQVAAEGADLDSAELVVGELLSNVVKHTDGPARISLSWEGTNPQLMITDRDPDGSGVRGEALTALASRSGQSLPDDPLALGGRGLYLVSLLAHGVVVDSGEHGMTIRVTLDVVQA